MIPGTGDPSASIAAMRTSASGGGASIRRCRTARDRIDELPVGGEVVDHGPDPVRAGERHFVDLRHRHALGVQQHYLGLPPGHHPAGAPADDPQQAFALVVIDLADAYSFCHPDSLAGRRLPDQDPNGASCHGRTKVL
ncbi:hypothetical protein O1G22_01950 [Streptomyces camelliae]|uniref:Uncharacterized protein n=1 Tax=Streptomyces camelliae TaxID=3004093 RepID=A0ABY7NTY7_9ACTN|nr:hypothetical protein [Streptomyces sp. HUAS 2-6]WBO61704.1 hypothetical protein O1G22_01950 [Streptomyces sp. HUAS 2-6]